LAQLAFRRALVAKRSEKQLMQNHRVARDQLLAFETVDHETGRCREIEFGELHRDRIEAIDRATIVVFVMTDEQLLRHSLDPRRIIGGRLNAVGHGSSQIYSSDVIEIVSKEVTLSALVHSATLPASRKVPSCAEKSALPSKETVKRSPSALSVS